MRDDIHRHVPVPRRHQQVFRACRHEVDWPTNAPCALERAYQLDLRDEVSPRFISVVGAAIELGSDMFRTREQCLDDALGGMALSRLEQDTKDYLASDFGSHDHPSDAVCSALTQALCDRAESNGRAAETALAARFPKDRHTIMDRYRAVASDPGRLEALAREHLSMPPRADAPPKPVPLSFSLDMDIGK